MRGRPHSLRNSCPFPLASRMCIYILETASGRIGSPILPAQPDCVRWIYHVGPMSGIFPHSAEVVVGVAVYADPASWHMLWVTHTVQESTHVHLACLHGSRPGALELSTPLVVRLPASALRRCSADCTQSHSLAKPT